MAEPPFEGAVQLTVACPSPAAAVTPVGAAGAVGPLGVTLFDAAEAGLVATEFVALTLNVYAVPLVRLPIVAEVAGGDPLIVTGAWAEAPMYGVTV